MICKNCGQLLNDSDEFCFKCGTIFTAEELTAMRQVMPKTVPVDNTVIRTTEIQESENIPRQPEKTVPLEAVQNAPRQPEKTVPLEAVQNAPRQPEKTVPLEAIQNNIPVQSESPTPAQNIPRQPEKTVPLEAFQNVPVQTEAPAPRQPEKTVPLEAIQNSLPVQPEAPVSAPVPQAPATPMRPSNESLGRISAASPNSAPQVQPRTPVSAGAPAAAAAIPKSSNASKIIIACIAVFVALALVIFGTVGGINGWFSKKGRAQTFLHQNLNEDYTDYLTDHILTEDGLFNTDKPDQNTEGLLSALTTDFDGDGNDDLFTVTVHHGSIDYTYYSNNGNTGSQPTQVSTTSVPIPENTGFSSVTYYHDDGNGGGTVLTETEDEQSGNTVHNTDVKPPKPGPVNPPAFPDDYEDEEDEEETTLTEPTSETEEASEPEEAPSEDENEPTSEESESATEATEPASEEESEQSATLSVREKNEIRFKELIDYYDSFGIDKRSVLDIENPTEEDFYNWYKSEDAEKQGVIVISEYSVDAKTGTVSVADYSNIKDKLGDGVPSTTATTQPATETLDVNSQQVQTLLKKVQGGEPYKLTLINLGTVDSATMTNDLKLAAGYNYATNIMDVKPQYPMSYDEPDPDASTYTYQHAGYPCKIPTAKLDEGVKSVFGPDVTVEHKAFIYYSFEKYSYFENYSCLDESKGECNENVAVTFHGDGGGGDVPYVYESLYRAEQQGDEIRLYVKYAFVDIEYEYEEYGGSNPFIHHLYSDYDPSLGKDEKGLKNPIGTIDNFDYREFEEYQGNESNNYYWEAVYHSTPKPYQSYIDGMHECCYYFTKASDGEYYFSGFELNPTK